MAIDDTARESNIKDSIKRFLVDNIYSTSGIAISFDKGLTVPKVQGTVDSVKKWVSVRWGVLQISTVAEYSLQLYLCSKQDKEGFKLAQLRDTVMGYLTDSTQNDGGRRVILYKSNVTPWTELGSFIIYIDGESGGVELDDKTKCKIIDITLRWGCKG